MPFRQAICNEVFEDWDFGDACRAIRAAGYSGIEISPFTLSPEPASLSAQRRRECSAIIRGEGLEFAGLHWLMVAPEGLHVTTPDAALRDKSWRHIRDLVDLCADLGDGGVMVFGSPKQRNTIGGSTVAEATARYRDGLAAVAPHALSRGVTILVEALPAGQCDVVNTLEDAARIVNEIGVASIQTMFDTHNAVDELELHAVLIERYFSLIRHVHVNELDGRHPGTGDYDFRSILRVLEERHYSGWVSLEVFDFSAGAEAIAGESLRYLKAQIST